MADESFYHVSMLFIALFATMFGHSDKNNITVAYFAACRNSALIISYGMPELMVGDEVILGTWKSKPKLKQ